MSSEYGNDFITLSDEDGNEFELEHLDSLEYEGETYMAFVPADQADAEEAEMIILMVEEVDGEEMLSIPDDDVAEKVYELFMERIMEAEDGAAAPAIDEE